MRNQLAELGRNVPEPAELNEYGGSEDKGQNVQNPDNFFGFLRILAYHQNSDDDTE